MISQWLYKTMGELTFSTFFCYFISSKKLHPSNSLYYYQYPKRTTKNYLGTEVVVLIELLNLSRSDPMASP